MTDFAKNLKIHEVGGDFPQQPATFDNPGLILNIPQFDCQTDGNCISKVYFQRFFKMFEVTMIPDLLERGQKTLIRPILYCGAFLIQES